MRRRRKAERKAERAEELRMRRAQQEESFPTVSFWRLLKAAAKPVDGIILLVAVVYLAALLDFSAMTLSDIFYLTAIIMWSGSFIVRLYLFSKRGAW